LYRPAQFLRPLRAINGPGGADGVAMRLDGIGNVPRVATAQRDYARKLAGSARLENHLVAPPQSLNREPKAAKPIVEKGVHARLIEHNPGPKSIEQRRQMKRQRVKVFIVGGAVCQPDVQ